MEGEGNEILTLQFGNVSNHIGTHFWNCEDECLVTDLQKNTISKFDHEDNDAIEWVREMCPERLFRSGTTFDGKDILYPRMVLMDFKHTLGSLNPTQTLFDPSPEALLNIQSDAEGMWGEKVEIHKEKAIEKNDFLKWLESDISQEIREEDQYSELHVREDQISVWSDFLKCRYHPRSTNLLHKYGDVEFDCFTHGVDMFSDAARENFIDAIRFFLEECGRIQGYHIFVDINSGYGSIAHDVLQELKDETRSAAMLTFGVVEPEGAFPVKNEKQAASKRDMNEAIAASRFSEVSSVYVPMLLYSISSKSCQFFSDKFQSSSLYHSSALAACAVDTASMVYRRKEPGHGLNDIASMRELAGRLAPSQDIHLAALSMTLPVPYPEISKKQTDDLVSHWQPLDSNANAFEICLSTRTKDEKRKRFPLFGSSIVMRGIHPVDNDIDFDLASFEGRLGAYAQTGRFLLEPAPLYSALSLALPIPITFPDIFNNHILGERGQISVQFDPNASQSPPLSVPMTTHLENSARLGNDVVRHHKTCVNSNFMARYPYSTGRGGFDSEDFAQLAEHLDLMKYEYHDRHNDDDM